MMLENTHIDETQLPKVAAALSDLAGLTLRVLSAGEQQRHKIVSDLLERLMRLSEAPRGGIVELIAREATLPVDIRHLALLDLAIEDVKKLVSVPDITRVIHKAGDWLRFELPTHAIPTPSAASAIGGQQSHVILLLGWPSHTPSATLQQAHALLPAVAAAAGTVMAALHRPDVASGSRQPDDATVRTDPTWEQIFDAVSDPMCVVTADYRLERANAAYIKLFGLNRYGVPGHECYAHIPGQAGPCADCPLPNTIRSGEVAFVQQERLIPVISGTVERRTYQCWTYPIFRTDGTVDRIVEILKDVTEQERARQALSQAEALREADRLKSELLGTVGHELRSPLTTIKGYAATLLRHEHRLPREERREFLTAIVEASDTLQVIIDRLLEMSQIETGTLPIETMDVDIQELVQAAHDDIKHANAVGARPFDFAVSIDPPGPANAESQWTVEGDPRLLREMLDNLLENAVKYSPAGGRIEIALHARAYAVPTTFERVIAADHPTHAEVVSGARTIEIIVSDTGMGIPEEHLEHIFERFHRVDTRLTREVGGLGLGLAICQRIVERHGGLIWAESLAGEGSSFHVQLPAANDTASHLG